MLRTALILAAAACLVGCPAPAKPRLAARPASRPSTTRAVDETMPDVRMVDLSRGPRDARGPAAAFVRLDVYLLDVPGGSVSRDEAFWRMVDETAVGVAADQRLLANGIRCGVAPRNQWAAFRRSFAHELTRARRSQTQGITTQTIQLQLDQRVDREDVFFLDADGQLEGRSYDEATNGVALTFGPAPRVTGAVRVTLCPIVKREQRRLAFSPMNQAYETPASDVDRIYDAGLTVDVPADGFLVVAPGPGADPDLTLGGRFLLRPDVADRREQVIIVVPVLVPLAAAKPTAAK